ncbi:MAG: hypothetical protein WEA75_01025 [Acidimicrobiia bacterium]
MLDLLPGWEYRKRAGGLWQQDGGSMVGGAEWSLVLHTMESWDFEGSMNYLTTRGLWPQLCYNPRDRRKVQGIPLTRAGKALANKAGGVQTNRENTIQVEMPGYAGSSHDWDKERLDNIAIDIVIPLQKAGYPIQLVAPKFVGLESGTIASPSAPQRMSYAAWAKFGGVCGHQHVPENDHWDPGRLDIERVLATARGTTPVKQEDNVRIVGISDGTYKGFNLLVEPFTDPATGKRDVGITRVSADVGVAPYWVAPSFVGPVAAGVPYKLLPGAEAAKLRTAPPGSWCCGASSDSQPGPSLTPAEVEAAAKDGAAAALADSGLLGLLPGQ